MTYFIAHFKPEEFWPVPEGTVLRYRGHSYDKDTKQYSVWMDVLGDPPKDFDREKYKIYKVDDNVNIPLVSFH